jgi:hypothetical protein
MSCRCSFLVYLPKELHDAKVAKERCEVSLRGGVRLEGTRVSRV